MAKSKPFRYDISPSPRTWQETAKAIASLVRPPRPQVYTPKKEEK